METILEDFSLLTEPCASCRAPIEAISPEWYRLDMDLDRMRVRWRYAPDSTALCVRCTLGSLNADEREARWTNTLEPLLTWKNAAHVPDDATLFHHRTMNKHVHGVVNGVFNFDEYFCHARGPIPETCVIPRRVITPDNGTPPLTLIYVGSEIRLDGVPATIRLCWDITNPAREGVLSIDGWSRISPADLSRLMEGVRVFMLNVSAGRHRGGTTYTIDGVEDRLRDYLAWSDDGPRRSAFLDYVGIPKPTWDRYMRKWGTNWSTLLKQAHSNN